MNNLRQYRKARTMSQTDLARIVGVSQKTISQAERDVRPSLALQARLATVLGVSMGELFPAR